MGATVLEGGPLRSSTASWEGGSLPIPGLHPVHHLRKRLDSIKRVTAPVTTDPRPAPQTPPVQTFGETPDSPGDDFRALRGNLTDRMTSSGKWDDVDDPDAAIAKGIPVSIGPDGDHMKIGRHIQRLAKIKDFVPELNATDEFSEPDHQRAENGQFASGSGGASTQKAKGPKADPARASRALERAQRAEREADEHERKGEKNSAIVKRGRAKAEMETYHKFRDKSADALDQAPELTMTDQARAAGVLYLNAGRVLLLLRSPSATDYPSVWGFPAGHVESGESPDGGAIRESREEVGYAPSLIRPLLDKNGFVLFTCGDYFEPTLNQESIGYVWAPVDALPKPLHPGVEDAITKAVAQSSGMDKRDFDTNGWFEVKNNPLSKVGIYDYRGNQLTDAPDPSAMYKVYRPAEELSHPDTIKSFKLLPWINDHVMLGKGDGLTPAERKGVHGVIGQDVYFDKDSGTLFGNIKTFSSALADAINAGKKELSCGYRCEYDWTPGTWNGQRYDAVQRNIRGNHLATVRKGRMGPDVAVLDHSDTDCMTFTCDSTFPEVPTMPNENVSTGRPEQTGGLSLEEARAKFAEVVGALDKILPVMEALAPILGQAKPAEIDNGADARSKDADDVGPYADPDQKKYPLRNAEEIRAAWDYIHVKSNAAEFPPDKREEIEERIERAWKEHIDPKGPPEADAADARTRDESEEERKKREAEAGHRVNEERDRKGEDEETEEERLEREREATDAAPGKNPLTDVMRDQAGKIGSMDEAAIIRRVSSGIARRDDLARRVARHVGTFDHSAMDEQQVAEYAVRKIGLRVNKGHELTAVGVYLGSKKAPSERPTTRGAAMDATDWLDRQSRELAG